MKLGSKFREIYHTLRHIKPVQLSYRLKYELNQIRSLKKISTENIVFSPLSMLPLPSSKKYIKITKSGISVKHLNLPKTYADSINWADMKHGRLWNYHLQYADFLKQEELSFDVRKNLILDLYQWLHEGKLQPEPYPASLRIMNVIRFLSDHENELKTESELVDFVNSELHFLKNRIEYHLLGNHLMENAFALLMGGVSFNNQHWIHKAEEIFDEQIHEQILNDGAHFERSPMYHLILLFRFLEAIYYLPGDSRLSSLFFETSKKMLVWIDQMSFNNGDLAHFNDSTDHQSYSKQEIVQMAENCGILSTPPIELSDSGYKKIRNKRFELIIDAEGIEPSYQPGHAHADSLSFILQVDGKPFITDPGISTYESGERRDWERSTEAHNTVTFNGQNTADVWSRFRVGRRPEVTIDRQTSSEINARLKHKLQSGDIFEHARNFIITKEFIEITDMVNLNNPVEGRLYFDPDVKIKEITDQSVEFLNGVIIYFNDVQQISQFSYEYASSFNSREKSNAIEYLFTKQSSLKIETSQK